MIDVVLLTHDRLDHLVATVTALRERTRDVPFRLTVVDNASGPAVRGWLAEHRDWFHRVIARASNDGVPAVQEGIDATESDPFVVSDPDLVVPDLEPSWLARLLALLERHPDFGLVAVELDPANSPLSDDHVAALRAERGPTGDPELREGNTGMHFQVIRRDALRVPYTLDREVCDAVRAAGYRAGWAPDVRAYHLGFDDPATHPAYARAKAGDPVYSNVELPDAPSLRALAAAAPVIAATRAHGISDEEVVDLSGTLSVIPGVRTEGVERAVVVGDIAALREAAATAVERPELILLTATLDEVGGRLADELAPRFWRGTELPAVGDEVLALAEAGDRSPVVRERVGLSPLEHREDWLRVLAAGAFGATERRVFVFTPA